MNKKQAQQEILRRLELNNGTSYAIGQLIYYDYGELSKQELIRMITIDEDGNLLSEPKQKYFVEFPKKMTYNSERFKKALDKWRQALNQATEIVNCYDGE